MSAQIAKEFTADTGTQLFRYTVRNRLHKTELYGRKPKICFPLIVDCKMRPIAVVQKSWGLEYNKLEPSSLH